MKRIYTAILIAVLLLLMPRASFSQHVSKWDGPGQHFFARYAEWQEMSRRKDISPEALEQVRAELRDLGLKVSVRRSETPVSLPVPDGQDRISVILTYTNAEALAQAEALGFKPQTRLEGMCTGLFPVQKAAEIEAIDGIRSLTLGHRQRVQNDVSRRLNRVNQVQDYYAEHGFDSAYTGQGVVIGVIDLGFDYTHPAFFTDPSDTSTFRIVRVWDQMYGDTTTVSPEGFDYGTELVSADEILSEHGSCDFFTIFRSEHHGTHVAATAAGSGYGTPYRGMAPGAELVFVSSELGDADIIDAVAYLKKYAGQAGKPCVVNMSFGLNTGPHDGTSVSDTALNRMAGPGFIIVASAGNSGSENIHTQGETDGTNPVFIGLDMGNNNASLMDVYDYGTGLEVVFCVFDTATGLIYQNEDETLAQISFSLATSVGSFVKERTLSCDKGAQRKQLIKVLASQQIHAGRLSNLYFTLKGFDRSALPEGCILVAAIQSMNEGSPTSFHAWCDGMEFSDYGCPRLIGGDSRFSHNASFATADSVISVGAYVSRSRWQVSEDPAHTYFYEGVGEEGDICSFSGRGPRLDGVMKPDISAPGSAVFSAANSFVRSGSDGRAWSISLGSLITVTEVNGVDYPWMEMQGTSMSTPAVSGIVALMLEQNPRLSCARIKNILTRTAQVDEFVEKGGANEWGAGKVDALKALLFMRDSAHIEEPDVEPDPVRDTVRYKVIIGTSSYGRLKVTCKGETITGGQMVDSGSVLEIEAIPDEGYELKRLFDCEGGGLINPIVCLTCDTAFCAMFGPETVKPRYTVYVRQTANGKVKALLDGEEHWSGEQVLSGSVMHLVATPNSGYELDSWWNGETRLEFDYTVTADVEIKATFRAEGTGPVDTTSHGSDTTGQGSDTTAYDPVIPAYTVNIDQTAGGTVRAFLENFPLPSGLNIDSGTVLMLVAEPDDDYRLKQWWNGETRIEFAYTVREPVSIKAEFERVAGSDTAADTGTHVWLEPPLSAGAKSVVRVYPNPSRGIFHLVTATDNLRAELYTAEGRLLRGFDFERAGEYTLNLRDYPAGIYILSWKTGCLRLVLKP